MKIKKRSILLAILQFMGTMVINAQHNLWQNTDESFENPPLLPQDNIRHVKVRSAELPSTFLIGSAIAEHKGIMYASWATGPDGIKENGPLEHVKVKRSLDQGSTWQDEQVLAPVVDGLYNHSHGSFWSVNDTLNFFSASFTGHTRGYLKGNRIFATDLKTERFYLEETTQTWVSKGIVINNFFPMDEPRQMANGNFIMAGLDKDLRARVAISKGQNPGMWETVPIPQNYIKGFPEPTTLVLEDEILLIIRNYSLPEDEDHFCVSTSTDNGKNWTSIGLTNFKATKSKPYGGILSSGRPYLISNLNHRKWICISLGEKGTSGFSKIFRLRPGDAPFSSYFKGGDDFTNQQWAYPYALEYNNNLYVIYHQNKLDAELTIIPLKLLNNITLIK
ncbi:exo-alpha-sialidase [Arenibacter sp. M-2]|uniref:exo-alpha-sialidase n=1 Tax=Arenibacter sp. M-2 TaxID=3053612 RepID=UPI0025709FDA|nr:exo-alpha-sialidase [Arenibacter sp. M-2]MDL5512920.1 exo-alpha-sialidase [Arenibacter sp. M-2]